MSTFNGLSTAYTGLSAARAALEVTGQNVSNANTEGYTRQRVDQSAMAPVSLARYSKQTSLGDGVLVTGVSRLTDAVVSARVQTTASVASYWGTTASALSAVETSLNEPSSNGLSATLSQFWNAWQTMANHPGDGAAAQTLISKGQSLAGALSSGYVAVRSAYAGTYTTTGAQADQVNATAQKIADMNVQIRSLSSSGGNVNTLLDLRDGAVKTLSQLTGATTRNNADGTIDVMVGGNMLVSGVTSRDVKLVGAAAIEGSTDDTTAAKLVWTDTGTSVSLDGGKIAANLASMAPIKNGVGGVYAEAAKAYDDVAAKVHDDVNGLQVGSYNSAGAKLTTGFFTYSGTGPAATQLTVVPTGVAGIAAGSDPATSGSLSNSVADAISRLGADAVAPDGTVTPSADSLWSAYVSKVGNQTSVAQARSTSADTASTAAVSAQTSVGGVDLDEETSNLVIYQHAYQASARVISTINDMLDTLMRMAN